MIALQGMNILICNAYFPFLTILVRNCSCPVSQGNCNILFEMPEILLFNIFETWSHDRGEYEWGVPLPYKGVIMFPQENVEK